MLHMFDAVLYAVEIVASFYKIHCEQKWKWGVVRCVLCACYKLPGLCFCQELAKL